MGPFQDTTTNTAIIPEIWSGRFYEVLRVSLPFLGSVSTDYQGEITDLGDTVNISTIEDFEDAGELAEGASGDTDIATISGQQLLINKRTYKDFKVTKKSQLQSLPFVDSMREKAVFAINKRMQQLIIDAIIPSASNPDNSIGYDSGTTLAWADILEAKELLDNQNVAFDGRVLIVGSAQWNDIFNIDQLISRDYIPSGSPSTTGTIETGIAGFMPKMTTVVGNTSYFLHPSFLTMAIQQNLNVEVHNLGADGVRGARVNNDILWGLKQLSNIRVVTIA